MFTGDHQSSDVGPWGQEIVDSDRHLLLTFIFELAGQHAKRCWVRDSEEASREIAMNAFEQLWRQPSARNKVCQSLKDGNEDWKRVAHMCVIHARAEAAKRALLERRRRAAVPMETLHAKKRPTNLLKTNGFPNWLPLHGFLLDDDRKLVLQLLISTGPDLSGDCR